MHDIHATNMKLLDLFIIICRQYVLKFYRYVANASSLTRLLTLVTMNCKTCDTYGGEENCIQVGQPKIKRQLLRPRRKWKKIYKMDL